MIPTMAMTLTLTPYNEKRKKYRKKQVYLNHYDDQAVYLSFSFSLKSGLAIDNEKLIKSKGPISKVTITQISFFPTKNPLRRFFFFSHNQLFHTPYFYDKCFNCFIYDLSSIIT